jgi:hypothetical protein
VAHEKDLREGKSFPRVWRVEKEPLDDAEDDSSQYFKLSEVRFLVVAIEDRSEVESSKERILSVGTLGP